MARGQLFHVQGPSGRPLGPLKLAQTNAKDGVPKKSFYLATRAAHIVARRRVVIRVIARVICRGVIGLWGANGERRTPEKRQNSPISARDATSSP